MKERLVGWLMDPLLHLALLAAFVAAFAAWRGARATSPARELVAVDPVVIDHPDWYRGRPAVRALPVAEPAPDMDTE